MKENERKGFTILELTIVLVVISLIVGGVVVGKNMVKNAELRSIVIDIKQFQTATYSFLDKYDALPGDIPDAAARWGIATVDGDGNGIIDVIGGDLEGIRAWEHLNLSDLLPGSYNGELDPPMGGKRTIGLNVPASRIDGNGYDIFEEDLGIENIYDKRGNYLRYGSENLDGLNGPALTPTDAWSIDAKIDDGKAREGDVRTETSWEYDNDGNGMLNWNRLSGCINAGEYDLSDKSLSCNTLFWLYTAR